MFKKLTIAARLYGVLGFLSLLLILVGVTGINGMQQLSTDIEYKYKNDVRGMELLGNLQEEFQANLVELLDAGLHDPRLQNTFADGHAVNVHFERMRARSGRIQELVQSYLDDYVSELGRPLVLEFEAARQDYVNGPLREAVRLMEGGDYDAASDYIVAHTLPTYRSAVAPRLDAMIEQRRERASTSYEASMAEYGRQKRNTIVIIVLGLLLGAVGTHPFTGSLRFTFGEQALYEGFPVIVGIVGLFSISQVLYLCHGKGTDTQLDIPTIGPMWPGWVRMLGVKITYIRSAIIGTFIGLLPGAGADIAAFIGRSEAHRFSKKPDEYGKGSYEAVVGAEAANNAVVGGSLIPMLTLGIPGNAVTAALIGGLLIHGIIPGPRLFVEQPQVIYPFILSLLAANLFFSIAAFGGLKYLAKVVLIPRGVLAPVVAVLSVLGAFSYRNMLTDVWLMLFLGVIGYILRRTGFPLAPIILGIILGPLAESNLERVMTIARARRMSLMDYFLQNEVTIVLMVLTIAAVGLSVLREIRHQRSGRSAVPTGDE